MTTPDRAGRHRGFPRGDPASGNFGRTGHKCAATDAVVSGTLAPMTDLQKFQRVCRVLLARLLTAYGTAAPDLLRRIADELEWLEAERVAELDGRTRDPPN